MADGGGWQAPGAPPPAPLPAEQPPGWGQQPGWSQQPGWGQQPGPSAWSQQPGWGQPSAAPPAARPGVIPLRPLAVAELLDGAVQVVRRHPRALLLVAAAIAGVQALLVVVVPLLLGGFGSLDLGLPTADPSAPDGGTDLGGGTAGFSSAPLTANLATQVGSLVGSVLGALFTGYAAVVVGAAVRGRPVGAAAALRQVRGRALALLGVAVVGRVLPFALPVVAVVPAVVVGVVAGAPAGLLLGVPLVLLALVAAVYLFVAWTFAPAVLVLERTRVLTSLRRSRSLVRGAWWRVLGIGLLGALVSSVVAFALVVPVAAVGVGTALAGGPAGGVVVAAAIGGGLASVLTTPFAAALRTLLYVERRIRLEALDLALVDAARADGTLPRA